MAGQAIAALLLGVAFIAVVTTVRAVWMANTTVTHYPGRASARAAEKAAEKTRR